MHRSRRRFFLSILMSASLAPGAFAACTVNTPPPGWQATALRWDGSCEAGLANGLGVLKEQQGTRVLHAFFGRAEKGELTQGVIDTPDQGYSAGRFVQGHVQDTDERQVLIDAFETAAQAAGGAAERFEKAGNKASAQFYRQKEKALREQLD